MKHSRTFSMPWRLLIAVLAGTAVAAGTSASLGQAALAPAQAQNAAPTIFLGGPGGDRMTLVRSPEDGWQLQAGWSAGGTEQRMLERPLSVFVDGPTGITFIYVLDEGWKFVGRVVDRPH